MGRIGTLQARWTTLSRLGRAGLVAAAVGVGAVLTGAAVDTTPGRGTPPPVVWHDRVSDSTITPPTAP